MPALTRRNFLLSLCALPAYAETIVIHRSDEARAKHSEQLRALLLQDILDMDVHKQLGPNLARIRQEDRLYAQIQADRRW